MTTPGWVEMVPVAERDRLRELLAKVLALHEVGVWSRDDWATIASACAEVDGVTSVARPGRCAGCVDAAADAASVLGWDEDMIRALAVEFAALRPIAVRGCPVSVEHLEEVRRRVATVMRNGLVDACPDPAGVDDESRRRWIGRIAEWSDWIHVQYAAVLTGDPTGARHELVARGGGAR